MASASAWALFDGDDADTFVPATAAPAAGSVSPVAPAAMPAASSAASSSIPSLPAATAAQPALVSIAAEHTLPHVHAFLEEHLSDTLTDLDAQASALQSEDDITALRALMDGLRVLNAEVLTLTRAAASKGQSEGKRATGAASGGGSDDTSRRIDALIGLSAGTQEVAFARLRDKGAWPHVCWREAYVMAALVHSAACAHVGQLGDAMKSVDMALILGAPARDIAPMIRAANKGMTALAAAHRAITRAHMKGAAGTLMLVPPASLALPHIPAHLTLAHARGREDLWESTDVPRLDESKAIPRVHGRPLKTRRRVRAAAAVATAGEDDEEEEHPYLAAHRRVHASAGTDGGSADAPLGSTAFRKHHVKPRVPVILMGVTRSWHAHARWRDLQSFSDAYGHRTVPVELGQHLSGTWKETPMLLRDFVTEYMAPSVARWGGRTCSCGAADVAAVVACDVCGGVRVPSTAVAYVAQHGLFEQISELTDDFDVPVYAGDDVGAVNAWMGTAGTVTRLHFDSYENLLTQVFGYKYVRLYGASETPKLYPIKPSSGGVDAQGNTSAVAVERLDASAHPLALDAVYSEAILGPGDMLYIPKGCWHYVRSLTPSFSVNFWF